MAAGAGESGWHWGHGCAGIKYASECDDGVSDRQGIKLALGPLRDAMIGLVDVCWSELPDEWLEALNNDFTLAMLHETVNKLEAARSIFGEWVS